MPAHKNSGRGHVPELEALTREAFEDLRLDFDYICKKPRMPPLIIYPDTTKRMIAGEEIKEYLGMVYNGKIYLNESIAEQGLDSWKCLHTVGEEVGHHLHAKVNRTLEAKNDVVDKKKEREKYREYSSLQELVGYWTGCLLYKARTGNDFVPIVQQESPWVDADDEHYWGYYTAAHLIMMRAPLRIRDFMYCTKWEQAHDVYKQFLDYTPDFSKEPPKA